ncbi:MAG: response regulator [Candidatus Omnitrophica bacterium]|nr:response regulator [Candidatus Omnitrophota bacterium]
MNKRILIADDEPTVVALARQKLEEHGFFVETARNGKEAWDIIKSVKIDLLILDVIMPVMDGVDVYKEMKKEPKTANIPIIIITDNRIFRESFQTLGVEHFLPKPMDGEKLLHKVDYVFTCADLERKNKQALILTPNLEGGAEIAKILQDKGVIVGKTSDPIEFLSNSLILAPKVVFIDILTMGEVPATDVIAAMKAFGRLKDTRILVFTQFSPDNMDSMEGIEQLRQAKNDCMEAGAHQYIGRFTPATFWDMVKDALY